MSVELSTPPATCTGCGATLAGDQRYCLACGSPCSPVRLPFLDVLQAETQPTAAHLLGPPSAAYPPPPEPDGLLGSLRRYSGLLALLGVLLACLLIGLLVGHWVSGNATTGPQVVRIEGISGPLAAAPAAAATTAPASPSTKSTTAKSSQAPASSKAEEVAEAKEVKTAKALPPPKKTSATALQKIEKTTGKQHQKEINKLVNSTKPIETGGG
jgi:hypothetical protein